ncbi:MAG: molybdenum cofactor guanylyltransferase [Promethearchaeia archaeon]
METITSNKKKELAISILIGGSSSRFGREKVGIELLGKPLIAHQVETLSDFDEDVFLVASSDEQVFKIKKEIDFPEEIEFIVDDREFFPYPEIHTPILGFYSAFLNLNQRGFQKTFILSCDMPLIDPEVVNLLINEVQGYDCCIPRWSHGYLEPLCAIYPVKKGLQKTRALIEKKNFSLTKILEEDWNINYVSVKDKIKPLDKNLLSFININGPIDLKKGIEFYKKEL